MPVLAIIPGITGVAALGGAFGTLTAFQTIAAIGGIVSSVGSLTGNKTLMKIGAIAGLAGGVGAFAQGQGWIPSDAMSNTQAMTQTPAPGLESAAPPVADYGQAAGSNAIELGQTGASTSGLIDSGIQQSITTANPLVNETAKASTGLIDAAAPTMAQPSPVGSEYGLNPNVNAKDALLARGDVMSPLGQSPGIFDKLNDFSKFINENKELSKFGFDFLGGMFDERRGAETELYKARAATENQQRKNASDVPVLGPRLRRTGPVFPATAPTYTPPRTGGLMFAR